MEIQLRPYQTECVEKVVSQFKNFWAFLTLHTREAITASETLQQELKQLQTALVVLPTGGGKTVIFATIEIEIRQFLATRQKNLSTLILAHRQELLNQARDKYHMIDASQLIGLVGGGIAEYGAPVTVASIATVSQKNHLKNLKNFGYGLVIVDECFPAGTWIDGKPIEQVKAGDLVTAFDDTTGTFAQKKVVRIFRRAVGSQLLRITSGDHSVVCTPNHPFYTQSGWKNADQLILGEKLLHDRNINNVRQLRENIHTDEEVASGQLASKTECVLQQRVRQFSTSANVFRNNGGNKQEVRFSQDESQQPHEERLCAIEDANDNQGHRPFSQGQRREWQGPNGSTENASRSASMADGICDQNWAPTQESFSLSNQLQNRHSQPCTENSYRGGWGLSLFAGQAGAGCQENTVSYWAEVDRIEVFEPGSDGTFGGLCKDGYVYNFEVEDFHTYVANGFVVHNCHHVAAAGYQTVLDVLPWSFRLFVTATPDRLDGKPIVDHEPIYSAYITDMVREGFLTNILPILVRTKTQLDQIKTTGGDYNEHELEIAIDNPERNRRIVEAYQEHASGRPFLCFSVTVAHAEHIAEAFREAGIAVEAISGRMTSEERVRTLQGFESGKLQGLVNCLDTQTEILTRRGWVNHETIRPDDITATFNTATQTVEWQPISRIVKRERASEERMVHIKNQLLDIRVTEGHRMLIKAPGAHSWKFVEAGTLPTRQGPYQIPTASIAPTERQKDLPSPLAQPKSTCNRQLSVLSYNYRKQGATPERALELAKATMEHRSSLRTKPVAELTFDECRFIGLWITDGHIDRSKGQRGIQITQSGRYKEANLEIQRILTSCGFDWKHGTTTNAKTPHLIHRYDIPRGVIGGQLARKGYAHLEYYLEKDFHPDLFGLNQKQTHALVEGLWLGDGYKEAHRKDFYAYRTSYQVSKTNLAYLERMQTLATLRGFAATLSKPIYNGPQSTKPIYNLRIRRRDTITTNNHTIPTSRGNPARFETNWQSETVWCVTNQNGTIVTRRNGKIAIMGQCGILTEGYDNPSTSCIILARPTKSRALVVQKIGRGLRLALGKSDCVVLDITDNILNHRLQPVTLRMCLLREI